MIGASFRSCVALALFAVLAVGCSPTAEQPPASADGLPAGVTVELRQTRADVAGRQAAVAVHNGTGRSIEIGAVSVADPRFAQPATRTVARTSTVPAGATVDIRVQLTEVACDAPADATATVTLDVRDAETDAMTARTAPIVDVVPFVAALHENECLQVAAGRSAAVSLGRFTASAAGEPARLDLDVVPAPGEGTLRIVGIHETNLLTFPGLVDAVYPLDLDQTGTDRKRQSVALPLLPARCDARGVVRPGRDPGAAR
ncbi:MAG: hypothetical protein P0Y48_10580 [Candidatus Microbacterium phytovorans]|uniref:Lipoprotein n=1 Tax=Candidatus Microbacterium phytovorans TaxID=3121374 RepID=A0AAJ6B399_9MICO|nr:hypothetical protein [Microbacterium sp.]WEK12907.1 MAG: hypothetical protein P0Y48_10580 [Microbacterium sp.]